MHFLFRIYPKLPWRNYENDVGITMPPCERLTIFMRVDISR